MRVPRYDYLCVSQEGTREELVIIAIRADLLGKMLRSIYNKGIHG